MNHSTYRQNQALALGVLVRVLDHARERRGLAGTGDAGHEHQAASTQRELLQLVNVGGLAGDQDAAAVLRVVADGLIAAVGSNRVLDPVAHRA